MTRAPRMPGNPPARMISPEDTPPQQGADAHRQGDAQLVQHYAAWDLQHRIKPEEAAEQPAELDARQPELRLDLRCRDGKIDAIDVIDKDAEREQRTDPPAQPWYGVAKCHHFLRLFLVYPAHLRTRKSSGDMMRKLSDTLSHNMCHLLGTSFRKKPSTASQKPLSVV